MEVFRKGREGSTVKMLEGGGERSNRWKRGEEKDSSLIERMELPMTVVPAWGGKNCGPLARRDRKKRRGDR